MMTKEEIVENMRMNELIGKLRAMDTCDVEVTSETEREHCVGKIIDTSVKEGKEGHSKTKGDEDAESVGDQDFHSVNEDAESVGDHEFHSVNEGADQDLIISLLHLRIF